MKGNISVFAAGLLFAIGLGVSGMTDADKVIGFLNVMDWDPSLAFVMGGAIGVHLLLFKLILRRESPLFAAKFDLPTRTDIDGRLIVGSMIFGVGWGMGGFCPGPGIVSAATLGPKAVAFTLAMLGGMLVFKLVMSPPKQAAQDPPREDVPSDVVPS